MSEQEKQMETEATETTTDTGTDTGTEDIKEDDYSKEQQQIDQEKANARRARTDYERAITERFELAAQLEQEQESKTELQERLKKATESKDIEFEELDTLTDPAVQRNLKKVLDELKERDKRIDAMEQKVSTYEKRLAAEDARTQKQGTVEKILKPLDDEFGAKFRNAAKKLADELVDTNKEPQPKDALEARDLMRKCYRQVSEKKPTEKTVSTDTGVGGVDYDGTKVKTGSRKDVLAEMRNRK